MSLLHWFAQADALNQDDSRDQQATVFMRMVFPKEKFEFYFEYLVSYFHENILVCFIKRFVFPIIRKY